MVWETGIRSQVESYQRLKKKMVLDTSLLNTQYYKARIKGKVDQSKETSGVFNLHLGGVANKKGCFGSLSTTVANYTFKYFYYYHHCY